MAIFSLQIVTMDESFEIEGIEEAVVAIETEPTLYECDDCVYKTKMKSNLFRHVHTRQYIL
jgi:hypothetical protein